MRPFRAEALHDGIDEVTESFATFYEAHAVGYDLSDCEDVANTVAAFEEESGADDILVNSAAMLDARSQVTECDHDLRDRDIAINLTAAYNVPRGVPPYSSGSGVA